VCAACAHVLTDDDARISVSGAHVHVFRNPSAIDYRIGCFSDAPGCRGIGDFSTVWTWFPGWAWRVAECANCGAHLGWSFSREQGLFYGLILERIVEP
jgi:hypothetical protein